jgi:hypothetical protein
VDEDKIPSQKDIFTKSFISELLVFPFANGNIFVVFLNINRVTAVPNLPLDSFLGEGSIFWTIHS